MRRKPGSLNFWSSFQSLLAWWRKELSALVPPRVRAWYHGTQNVFVVRFEEASLHFLQPRGEALCNLASIDLQCLGSTEGVQARVRKQLVDLTRGKVHRLFVCLPADKVLTKTLRLPLAVEENLAQTLSFELDRQTPFRPSQVYMAYRVLERELSANQLVLSLAVIPREILDHFIQRIAGLGLHVHGAALEKDLVAQGNDCPNFLPTAPRQERSRRDISANAFMAALLVTMIFGAAFIPVWKKREAAIALNNIAVHAKEQALLGQALRTALENSIIDHNFLPDKKAASLSRFALINELSKLVPDDTWISQMDITETEIQLQGETASASKLVELMEDSGFFRGTGSKSPLTKVQGTSVDRFHLGAELRPPSTSGDSAEKATEERPASNVYAPAPPLQFAPTGRTTSQSEMKP